MRITRHQLRRIIREHLEEERRLNEANIIQSAIGIFDNLQQALDQGIEKTIGIYSEKLRLWMEKNADKIPLYASEEQFAEIKRKYEETLEKADEAREQWKRDNPGKKPDWEKMFFGTAASEWLPQFFHDPAQKIMQGYASGEN